MCANAVLREFVSVFPAPSVSGVNAGKGMEALVLFSSFNQAHWFQCADEMLFTGRSEGEMLILPFHPPDTINQRQECCRC